MPQFEFFSYKLVIQFKNLEYFSFVFRCKEYFYWLASILTCLQLVKYCIVCRGWKTDVFIVGQRKEQILTL